LFSLLRHKEIPSAFFFAEIKTSNNFKDYKRKRQRLHELQIARSKLFDLSAQLNNTITKYKDCSCALACKTSGAIGFA
jgi:hypothetical protein